MSNSPSKYHLEALKFRITEGLFFFLIAKNTEKDFNQATGSDELIELKSDQVFGLSTSSQESPFIYDLHAEDRGINHLILYETVKKLFE